MANIFSQLIRPVRSMQEYGQDMDTAESNKLTLAANRMKAQQDQQGMADDAAVRSAYQSGGDENAIIKTLRGGGQYKAADALQKTIDERLKAAADRKKLGADTSKTEAETIDKSLQTAKGFVNQIQAPEQAAAYLNGLYKDPVLGPYAQRLMPLEMAISQIPKDQEGMLKWKAGHMAITGDKLIDLLKPKTDVTNMGANQSFGATDQFTGKRTETGSAPILESANNVANNARVVSEGALNRGVQVRGQNMVDSRARDAAARADGTAVAEAGGPSQSAFTKQFGKAPPGYRWKADGNAEAIPGGPADLKNNAGTAAKVTDAQDVLSLLDQAEPLLDKSTGSYLGAVVDEAGRAVGGATGGAKAAAQLRTIEGALISKMPKMSGPQSDKDVLLYKQMAGQIGDRTIPAPQKRAAMQTIREINNRHAGNAPKAALSPEDAQALEWANKNPNDPRAKQIKQRIGGG